MAWPPTLPDLKDDLAIPADETEDDNALQRRLAASIRFVQRVRRDAFETADDGTTLVEPVEYSLAGEDEAEDLELGTLMLAGRLFARRRSPDGTLFMSDTGTSKIAMEDDDISRLLRIRRHARPVVG